MSEASEQKRVVVVGAGWAGLGATYHLAQQGYDVTLLEAAPYPGGLVAGWKTPGGRSVYPLNLTNRIFNWLGLLTKQCVALAKLSCQISGCLKVRLCNAHLPPAAVLLELHYTNLLNPHSFPRLAQSVFTQLEIEN